MKGKNTQETYDDMCEVSKKDALKYMTVTKCIYKFNMDACCTKGNPMLKGLIMYYYVTD